MWLRTNVPTTIFLPIERHLSPDRRTHYLPLPTFRITVTAQYSPATSSRRTTFAEYELFNGCNRIHPPS